MLSVKLCKCLSTCQDTNTMEGMLLLTLFQVILFLSFMLILLLYYLYYSLSEQLRTRTIKHGESGEQKMEKEVEANT